MIRKYLTLAEVAEIARVSPSSVRFWISEGRLPSIKPGRRRLVAEEDLEAFLRNPPPRPIVFDDI